jgi:hypothetical protein
MLGTVERLVPSIVEGKSANVSVKPPRGKPRGILAKESKNRFETAIKINQEVSDG